MHIQPARKASLFPIKFFSTCFLVAFDQDLICRRAGLPCRRTSTSWRNGTGSNCICQSCQGSYREHTTTPDVSEMLREKASSDCQAATR